VLVAISAYGSQATDRQEKERGVGRMSKPYVEFHNSFVLVTATALEMDYAEFGEWLNELNKRYKEKKFGVLP
jgi:glutathione peroxidase-family protein